MPLDESIAHLQLVVDVGIVLCEPGREQPIPMPPEAAEQMCAELEARGEHTEAARHRRDLHVLQTVERQMAYPRGDRAGGQRRTQERS
jgi:hypothetical protein